MTVQHNSLFKVTRGLGAIAQWVLKAFLLLALSLSALWSAGLLWVHLPQLWLRILVIGSFLALFVCALMGYWLQWSTYRRIVIGYIVVCSLLVAWFLSLTPKQDRDWKAEVRHPMRFTRSTTNPNLITIHTVRDFDWTRPEGLPPFNQPQVPYFHDIAGDHKTEVVATERWRERTIDLNKLTGVDIINAYWRGKPIGHTLLSFRFSDDRPISFSFEIRKEQNESFSAIGGFLRKYEMILVAAEERDIVYTRTSVRGEQVYLFPISNLQQSQIQDLFLSYMQEGAALTEKADWYNTLIYNCTTVVYDLARQVAGSERIPWDYRILASGYVPEYLLDRQLLPFNKANDEPRWNIDTWYKKSHINPKIDDFSFTDNQGGFEYSQQIREGLPQPQPRVEP